jgi:AcrR family transcriptional regulator
LHSLDPVEAKSTADAQAAARRKTGRPRVLTLDEILDAAIAVGLANISMPTVAAKLGTGAATLYNYVKSRDELLRLAALKQARRPPLDDLGQDWRALAKTYGRKFYEFWSLEPQMLTQYMDGAIGPDLMVDYVESFLAAMSRRGFEPDAAYRVLSAVNTSVLGAVARTAYLRSLAKRGERHGALVARTLRERAGELTNLRACSVFADEERAYDFETILERVVESFAAEFDR